MTTQTPFLLYLLASSVPALGFLVNFLFLKKNTYLGSLISTFSVKISCLMAILGYFFRSEKVLIQSTAGFLPNELSWVTLILTLFISSIIHRYSINYFSGDRHYRRYFLGLTALTSTTGYTAAVDHSLMFVFFWLLNYLILSFLAVHKFEWRAAREAGKKLLIAGLLAVFLLTLGLSILCWENHSFSLSELSFLSNHPFSLLIFIGLLCILLAACAQSALWPFHKWLLSSLNAPTTISSFMHAGIINAGGLLLTRFAKLYLAYSVLLQIIFVIGLISLVLGTFSKLLQHDIKRMLACSTIGQMGFMFIQCGLGLFPAAVAHLCCHGLFKAHLFLRSPASLEEKKYPPNREQPLLHFLVACCCGLFGIFGFSLITGVPLVSYNTSLLLILFCWIGGVQCAYPLLNPAYSFNKIFRASGICFAFGILYGCGVYFIENTLFQLDISRPQPLNFIYLSGFAIVLLIWIALQQPFQRILTKKLIWKKVYLNSLKFSQPDKKTVTDFHEYQY